MLNLSNGKGGAYIRFSSQNQKWENSDKVDITLPLLVMDMESVRTGWLMLAVGQRDWQEDAQVGVKAKQPSPDHKRGFSVKLFSKPTGVVEWCTNQVGANKGFQSIFTECDRNKEQHPGKVPIISYDGATAVKIGAGNTSIPNFSLKNWIKRPAALDADLANAQADADYDEIMEPVFEAPQPVRHYHKGPVQSAKPKPAPAPAPVQDDEEMFN